jgi:CRP-like cAMP-binding protein
VTSVDPSAVQLLELVADCPRTSVEAGSMLLPAEFAGIELVVVAEGLVVLRSAEPGSSRRTITCHAGAGGLVLPPGEDEAVVALSDAKLRLVSTSVRRRLLASAESASVLLDALAATLRQKHATIANIARLHHVDRVRETLMELARAHGRVGSETIRLDFPVTHDLLAEMTGSARETVTRALDQLQREGFVVRRGRTYSVHVPPETLSVTPRTVRQ